jgi:hypothetical protein
MKIQNEDVRKVEMSVDAEQEFRQTLQRVGAGLKKNAHWFLSWIQHEPQLGTDPKVEQLCLDLLALSLLATRDPDTTAAKALTSEECRQWTFAANCIRYPWAGDFTTPKQDTLEYQSLFSEIKLIHTRVRDAIEQRLRGEIPAVLLDKVVIRLTSPSLTPVFPLSACWSTKDGTAFSGIEAPVLVRLAQVFQQYGAHFRRCPECQKLFLAARSDQKFCGTLDRARHGMRQLSQANKTEAAKKVTTPMTHERGGRSHGKKRRC